MQARLDCQRLFPASQSAESRDLHPESDEETCLENTIASGSNPKRPSPVSSKLAPAVDTKTTRSPEGFSNSISFKLPTRTRSSGSWNKWFRFRITKGTTKQVPESGIPNGTKTNKPSHGSKWLKSMFHSRIPVTGHPGSSKSAKAVLSKSLIKGQKPEVDSLGLGTRETARRESDDEESNARNHSMMRFGSFDKVRSVQPVRSRNLSPVSVHSCGDVVKSGRISLEGTETAGNESRVHYKCPPLPKIGDGVSSSKAGLLEEIYTIVENVASPIKTEVSVPSDCVKANSSSPLVQSQFHNHHLHHFPHFPLYFTTDPAQVHVLPILH